MNILCKICSKEFSGVLSLAQHIKQHRISQKKYFEEHFPRKDLNTKEKIHFKSLEQYFLSDFADKTSMKSWLALAGPETAHSYIANKIKKYCEVKKLECAPPEFFIQTISCLPSIRFIEKLCKSDYNSICESSSMPSRFDYQDISSRATNWKPAKQIVIDTREKRPLKFSNNLRKVNVALDYGDYALSPASKIVVERKSYSDFFGTFGANLERFERELKRAHDNNGYIIIMVESSYSSLAYTKRRWKQASPDYIFHRLRDLYKKFHCFQVVFCDGRKQMTDLVLKVLGLGAEVKKIDLQYCLEKEII